MIIEVLTTADPRAKPSEMRAVIEKDKCGPAERGAFEIICREAASSDLCTAAVQRSEERPNIMGGRFVLTIKDFGTGRELYKSQFVVQVLSEAEKALLVHNSTTFQKGSIRVLIALAAFSRQKLWTHSFGYFASLPAVCEKVNARCVHSALEILAYKV